MRSAILLGILSLAVLFSGCASIVRGTSQEVKFEAEEHPYVCMLPQGGEVAAPVAIKLSRRRPHRIVCVRRIEGPAPRAEFSVTHFESYDDWGRWKKYLGADLLLGGLVLPFVDLFIGGSKALTPTSVSKHEWKTMPQKVMIKGSY